MLSLDCSIEPVQVDKHMCTRRKKDDFLMYNFDIKIDIQTIENVSHNKI